MNWDAIGASGEIVGAVGVIVSLLYLALQVRADARLRRVAHVHEQSVAFRDFLQIIATNPDIAEIHIRGLNDIRSLKPGEFARFSALLGVLFKVYEEGFYKWSEGHLDAHVWHGVQALASDLLAYPGMQAWWSTPADWYSASFGEFVRGRISAAGAPRMYGESDAIATRDAATQRD